MKINNLTYMPWRNHEFVRGYLTRISLYYPYIGSIYMSKVLPFYYGMHIFDAYGNIERSDYFMCLTIKSAVIKADRVLNDLGYTLLSEEQFKKIELLL